MPRNRADVLAEQLDGWDKYRDGRPGAGDITGEHEERRKPTKSEATNFMDVAVQQRAVLDAERDARSARAHTDFLRREALRAQQTLRAQQDAQSNNQNQDPSGGWSKNSSAYRPN